MTTSFAACRARRVRFRALPLLLLAVTAWPAAAQEPPAVPAPLPDSLVERRVRLELAPQGRAVEGYTLPQVVRGTVLALPGDSIQVRIHGSATPFTIATSALAHVDVSHGIRTELESSAEGFARGAGTGALQWGLFNGLRDDPFFSQSFLQAAITGAAVGGIIGGVVGWLRPEERWHRLH